MVASLDNSVSSLPILDNDYDESSEDGSLLKGSNHEKLKTRTRPGVGKSFSMSEKFGNGGQLLRGKKKSYLNPRKSRLSVTSKDKNKGSVLKSLGKFLSEGGTGEKGEDDNDAGTVSTGINKFLGSIGGKKPNDSCGMEGFASLDDDGSGDEEEVNIKFHDGKGDMLKHPSVHTVTTAPPSFTSVFDDYTTETKSKNDDTAAPLQFVPSMEHSMHNSTSSMSAISINEMDDDDLDDVSVSSTEHSCALNDSIDSIGSFGEDCDDDENEHSDHEASKEDDHHKHKNTSSRKDHHSASGRQSRGGSASKKDKGDSKSRRERVPNDSAENTRRSRSKTARNRSRGDGLSSSNHSQRHRSSSNHSTRSTKSNRSVRSTTHRRTSSRGAVSTRTRPTKSSSKTGPQRSRSLGAVRGSGGTGGGPSKSLSMHSRSSHGNRKLERSSSGNDIREKYQQRSALHRQSQANKDLSSSSNHRPRMVRQSSEPAIRVDSSDSVGLCAFEW